VTPSFDLAIIGSGFSGALLALIARRLGLTVLLLERGRHPRFAIGESASPLAGVLIEQLADRYDLPRVRPLASYGAWQRAFPDVGCGLKRGFTYFKHEADRRHAMRPDRANQLLVAASPSDELSDTHWFRADVDHYLVREARSAGVEFLDQITLSDLEWSASGDPVLCGVREGKTMRASARFVVDASGPRGFLVRALGLNTSAFPDYPPTQALYSHFVDVARCDRMHDFDVDATPPFPVDDAALHHVFDGGWMWVLRFGNGVTSAGIAVTDALAAQLRLSEGAAAWQRLLTRYPSIADQFGNARPIREFTWMPRVASKASDAAGERWALLPSAAAFVDPLFSTGIPMTLLGIERLASLFERDGCRPDRRGLDDYSRSTLDEAGHAARFVAGCYAGFPVFDRFTAYSMFYFAAASFSEMTRRLGKVPPGFLCAADAQFAGDLTRLSPGHAGGVDPTAVAAAIERINIAGLCDVSKRNWYDVDLNDPVKGAAKLGATPDAVREMLAQFL
jgi:FADH2 O2-dependent halogenase